MALSLTDILGGSLVDGVSKIIGNFKASPEDKAKLQELIEQNSAAFQTAQLEYDEKLNDVAGQNIRSETGSSDKFTSRARPFFLYVMALAIGFNLFLPLASQVFGGHLQPLNIDAGYISLFSTAFLGYTAARSYEKSKGVA